MCINIILLWPCDVSSCCSYIIDYYTTVQVVCDVEISFVNNYTAVRARHQYRLAALLWWWWWWWWCLDDFLLWSMGAAVDRGWYTSLTTSSDPSRMLSTRGDPSTAVSLRLPPAWWWWWWWCGRECLGDAADWCRFSHACL